MATYSEPQTVYLSTLLAGTVLPKSSDMTVLVSVDGWEGNFRVEGVQPNTANVSAGWEVNVYRSVDNGTSYETTPSYGFSIARNPNVKESRAITLPQPGVYAIRITSAGSAAATWSFTIPTWNVVTNVANV